VNFQEFLKKSPLRAGFDIAVIIFALICFYQLITKNIIFNFSISSIDLFLGYPAQQMAQQLVYPFLALLIAIFVVFLFRGKYSKPAMIIYAKAMTYSGYFIAAITLLFFSAVLSSRFVGLGNMSTLGLSALFAIAAAIYLVYEIFQIKFELAKKFFILEAWVFAGLVVYAGLILSLIFGLLMMQEFSVMSFGAIIMFIIIISPLLFMLKRHFFSK